MKQITYLSGADQSMQPALIAPAEGREARPLAVCLHTWSYGLEEWYAEEYIKACAERNWHLIYPLFRGPNWNKEACGSDLVVSDLECAVEYMKENYAVDESRIYLVGGSGGGHASLLMAGRRPEIWTAVSSWCPISDVAAWFTQTRSMANRHMGGYADHIFSACGGDPTTCPEAMEQAKHRSPLTWLANAAGNVILDIGTGIHDGHTGSVPVSHAILAFNEVAAPEDRIAQADIDYIVEKEEIPSHLVFDGEDPAYGENRVLMRRTSGSVRLTLFEGGHQILTETAFSFLENQVRGAEPVWFSGKKTQGSAAELTK